MGIRVPTHEDNDRLSRVSARRVVTVPAPIRVPGTLVRNCGNVFTADRGGRRGFGQDRQDIVM